MLQQSKHNYLIDYTSFALFSPFVLMFCAFFVTFRIAPPRLLQRDMATTGAQATVIIDCDQRASYISTADPLVLQAISMVNEATETRQYNSGHLVINESFSTLSRVPNDTISSATDINVITTDLLTAAHTLLKAGDDESYAAVTQQNYDHVDGQLAKLNDLAIQYEQVKNKQCGITELEQ